VISYPCELDQILEFRMSQDFTRDGISSGVLDDALRVSVLVVLNLDDAWSKALFELLLVFPWDWAAKDDIREKTVGCGCYDQRLRRLRCDMDSPTGDHLACSAPVPFLAKQWKSTSYRSACLT